MSEGQEKIVVVIDPDIAHLIPRYLERTHESLAEMRRALDRGDLSDIRERAHRLKGSGAGFGFPELTDRARQLESATLDANVDVVQSTLQSLQDYLARCELVYPDGRAFDCSI